ncbi:hypothetical protein FHS18_004101 [Paenibacillus phyllosphaerae]|uniref:SEC-C motif-containing protein n=1 Tax=Paenibacillus phyllosphaerae TaxID=274593 RepID=A0A7W5B081_9BACL|nr:hypothetical protein [Paenibacillus phyllosphaerae]
MIGVIDKQAAEQGATKAEAKRWAAIEHPLHLGEALGRLTKDELVAVRVSLGLAKQSSLKKQDLIDMTVEQLPQAAQEAVSHMEHNMKQALQQLVASQGVALADTFGEQVVSGLSDSCIAFTGTVEGQQSLVMPVEVLEALKSEVGVPAASEAPAEAGASEANNDAVELSRNDAWTTLTRGLLYYYGTLDKVKLHRLLEQYTKQSIPSADLYQQLMDEAARGEFQYDETHGVSHNSVKDPARIAQEHNAGAEVPFYPFSMQQLIEAGQPGFFERTKQWSQFTSFLMENWSMGEDDASAIAMSVHESIQARSGLQEIVASMQEQLDVADRQLLEALVERVVELMKHTRQWTLKGHTPSDLAARREAAANVLARGGVPKRIVPNAQVHVQNKVGRNEPCTCGSGKKYKKCCGGN